MNSLLLLLALAATAAASVEYVYNYDSQVVNGVPHHAIQYTGVRIKAQLRFQMRAINRVTLQMDSVRVYKIDSTVRMPWPETGFLPDNVLVPIETHIQNELVRELTKPCKFNYRNGAISNVKMDSSDELWSMNIKRGILTNLKVTFREGMEADEEDLSDVSDDLYSQLIREHHDPIRMEENMYRVTEAGVCGICESVYSVTRAPGSDNVKLIKTRDYDRCEKQPFYEQGMISGLNIFTEPRETRNVVERSSHTNYDIKGTATDFIIQRLTQHSRYIFTPMTKRDGSAVTTVVQEMKFVNTKPLESPITVPQSLSDCDDTLMYDFPFSPMNGAENWDNGNNTKQDILDEIDRLLDEVVSLTAVTVKPEVVNKVRTVSWLMERLDTDDLFEFSTKYMRPPHEDFKKTDIILDILPTLVSPKVLKVVYRLITSRKVTASRGFNMLMLVGFAVSPDLDTIDFLSPDSKVSFQNPVIKNDRMLRRASMLNVGQIWRRWVKELQNEQKVTLKQAIAQIPDYYRKVRAMFEYYKTLDSSDRCIWLKAVGNARSGFANKFLTNVVTDKHEVESVRKCGMFSLKKQTMNVMARRQIQSVLVTVYMDFTETTAIRIGAFVALMDTKPDSGVLNMLTRIHRNEKSIQVGSFVYSYLATLAKAQMPGFREMAMNLTRLMPLVRPYTPSTLLTSKAVHYDFNNAFANMFTGFEVMKISEGHSMTPSHLIGRLFVNAFGKTMKLMETGMSVKGLDSILSKVTGVHRSVVGSMSKKSLKDLVEAILIPLQSGNVNLGSVASEIKSIVHKLSIVDRPVLDKLALETWISVLGNDIAMVDISADDILTWIQTGHMPILGDVKQLLKDITSSGRSFDFMKVMQIGTSTLQIPTSAGIPVSLNFTATGVAKVTGMMKLEGLSLREMMTSVLGGFPSDITLKTTLNPSMAWAWTAVLGADVGLIKTGVTLRGRGDVAMPGKLNFKCDHRGVLTGSFQLDSTESMTQKKNWLNMEMTPQVYVLLIDPTKTLSNRIYSTTTLSHPARGTVVQFTTPFSVAILNVKVMQKYMQPNNIPMWMSYSWLWQPRASHSTFSTINTGLMTEFMCEVIRQDVKNVDRQEMYIHEDIQDGRATSLNCGFGPGGNMENWVKATFGLVTTSDKWKVQLISVLSIPMKKSQKMLFGVMLDLDAFVPHKQLSPRMRAVEVLYSNGHMDFNFTMSPSPNDRMAWQKYRDNYLNVMRMLNPRDMTYQVITPQTEVPEELNFKYVFTTVYYSDTEMSHMTTAAFSAAMTTIYMKLGFPNLPRFFSKPSSERSPTYQGLITIVPTFQTVDIMMASPNEVQYFLQVPSYLYTPWNQLISLEPPVFQMDGYIDGDSIHDEFPVFNDKSYRYPLSATVTGTCAVFEKGGQPAIKTYDGVVYDLVLPPESCDIVLTQDCSQLSLFTVLMSMQQEQKRLKVLVPRHKIELIPEAELFDDSEVKVTVDGVTLTLTDDVPQELIDEQEDIVFGEVIKTGSWLTVRVPIVGVTLSTNGNKVLVKSNPYLRRHVCGICGNFNDETMDEYEGPDMTQYTRTEELLTTYVVPSQSCSKTAVREHFGLTEKVAQDSCEPVQKTVVVERVTEVCFSITPVTVCPQSCRASSVTEIPDKAFFCKPSNSFKTQQLVIESRQRVLTELLSKPTEYRTTVEVHGACTTR